jgi:hypothetical protein
MPSTHRYVHISMYIRTTLFLFDREALFYFAGLVHYSPTGLIVKSPYMLFFPLRQEILELFYMLQVLC